MEKIKRNTPESIQIPQFNQIVDDLLVGNNVFLIGGAGTGKTTLGEKVSFALSAQSESNPKYLPYVVVNCNQWTSPTDLIGGQTIEGYKEGRLIRAWKDGLILILDEMPKLDANTAGILNDALAKSAKEGAIIFNGLGDPVKKHPGFGCIATGNVIGKGNSNQYVGNNKQDLSLLDRFSGSMYSIGYNETLERALVYEIVADICIKIRDAIIKYESSENEPLHQQATEDIMTLRTMLNFERVYELELKRVTNNINSQEKLPPGMKGKTLRDCIESFFFAMDPDKVRFIRDQVSIEEFYNTYKGGDGIKSFLKEYNKRKDD